MSKPGGLQSGEVATRIPVRDLPTARRFYADKLGLEPVVTVRPRISCR